MERKVTPSAFLAPAANGWRVSIDAITLPSSGEAVAVDSRVSSSKTVSSLAEAVALLPSPSAQIGGRQGANISVAIPARLAIFERLTLPSTEREELEGMIRLQLEKILPYPVEETSSGFQILARREPSGEGESATAAEATVIVSVIHNSSVEAFCAPLLERQQYPGHLTIWAMHVAAQAPRHGTALGFWQEERDVVCAIFENGILSFSEIIHSPESIMAELPQVLMGAELAGAHTLFSAVLLDPALADLGPCLADYLAAPVEELRLDELQHAVPAEAPADLTLHSWREELARGERSRKLRVQLTFAGLAAAALVLLIVAYVGMLSFRLSALETELAKTKPLVDKILAQQARWKSLAPAIDQQRYTVEILYQTFQCLPSKDVRITLFDGTSPDEFKLEGEAPDAGQAVQVVVKLKSQPGLDAFHFEASDPSILQNEHAQFRVFGKL